MCFEYKIKIVLFGFVLFFCNWEREREKERAAEKGDITIFMAIKQNKLKHTFKHNI